MAIQIGGTTVIDNSRNLNVGIATFTRLDVPPTPLTFSPANAATNVAISTNIVITFNQLIQKGTGNITLRSGSAGGTAFSTIGVSSVTISGGAMTIDPPANIGFAVTTFVVVDAGAFTGFTTTSVNNIINTYSFTTLELNPGDSYEGGFLICKAAPVRWVVSPYSAEVSRNWYNRNDANTTAQSVSGCTGWFIPTRPQLQNPGYCCRSFWGPSPCYSLCDYWTSLLVHQIPGIGGAVNFNTGSNSNVFSHFIRCARAFRCVQY